MITVALEGLETLLKIGQKNVGSGQENPYANEIERCGGVDSIESLQ